MFGSKFNEEQEGCAFNVIAKQILVMAKSRSVCMLNSIIALVSPQRVCHYTFTVSIRLTNETTASALLHLAGHHDSFGKAV